MGRSPRPWINFPEDSTPCGSAMRAPKHLKSSANADDGYAFRSACQELSFEAAFFQPLKVIHRCLRAGDDNQVRLSQLIALGDIAQTYSGLPFEGVEVVEIGDMRQPNHGDVEHP